MDIPLLNFFFIDNTLELRSFKTIKGFSIKGCIWMTNLLVLTKWLHWQRIKKDQYKHMWLFETVGCLKTGDNSLSKKDPR